MNALLRWRAGTECSGERVRCHHCGAVTGQHVQIGRAGRGGDAAHALVMLRDSDMRLMHSLRHGCDCDVAAVKRILQALLDAARAAAARDATVAQKKGVAHRKRSRAAKAVATAPECTPKAKRKRRAQLAAEPANVENGELQPTAAGARPCAPCKPVAARAKCAPAARKAAAQSTAGAGSSDSESDADTSGSDDELVAPRPMGAFFGAAGPLPPDAGIVGGWSCSYFCTCQQVPNVRHMGASHASFAVSTHSCCLRPAGTSCSIECRL